MRSYYVYILANRSGTLYTGITNSLERRVYEHKAKLLRGFTARYKVDRLVYYEETGDVEAAITREKEIKAWRRSKKIALIAEMNPRWEDLASGWYGLSEVGAEGPDPSLRSG
jgi:putative endonuclease